MPCEFTSIIAAAVHIPPQTDTGLALSKLHDVFGVYINKHPDAPYVMKGDFNKANFTNMSPAQLDCYSQFRNGYKARSLPAFSKSDYAAIFLIPEYNQTGI